MSASAVKVLYVCGAGRSGSTILDRVLGQVEGFFSAGEFRVVWDGRLVDQSLCGCGAEVKKCSVWRAILEEAFGGVDALDGGAMNEIYSAARMKSALRLLAPGGRRALAGQLEPHAGRIASLYRAIQSTSGCRVIVDSSKVPAYGYMLGKLPEIALYVVHLIRDPRAVAYSWQRQKLRRDMRPNGAGPRYMDRQGPVTSALVWNASNFLPERLWRNSSGRYLPVRYEDFVADARAVINRILDMLGERRQEMEFINGHIARLAINHTFSGNPDRLDNGWVRLRPDDEWKRAMKRSHRAMVTALTWPLLVRYGYDLRGRAGA